MKPPMLIGMALSVLLSWPLLSTGQEPAITGEKSVNFPLNYKCSANSPCRNVTGEITRIEESYWITTPEGGETHLKVTRDTKMDQLPKVGDKIAAQLTSTGDANAIAKLEELPKPKDVGVLDRSQKEVRQKMSSESDGKMQRDVEPPSNGNMNRNSGSQEPSREIDPGLPTPSIPSSIGSPPSSGADSTAGGRQ